MGGKLCKPAGELPSKEDLKTIEERIEALLDDQGIPFIEFYLLMGALSDNGATPWVTPIGLGTPPQYLAFMMDTGTYNTWITSSECTTDACLAHDSFHTLASTTFQPLAGGVHTVSFGPWGNMTVKNGNDVVHLHEELEDGSTKNIPLVQPINIMLALEYTGDKFKNLVCDGGMALPSKPDTEATSLLEVLKAQDKIEYAVASFYTDPVNGFGECRLGGINRNYFDRGSLNVLPLIVPSNKDFNYLWTVNLQKCICGDNTVAQDIEFVLDTGSSWFKGGQGIINTLTNAITDNGELPTTVTPSSDLDKYPDIFLVLGSVSYRLTPQQYFLEIDENGKKEWVLGVHYLEGMPDQMLLVGSTFLDTVCSVFDYDKQLIYLSDHHKSARPRQWRPPRALYGLPGRGSTSSVQRW